MQSDGLSAVRLAIVAFALAFGLMAAAPAMAQTGDQPSGKIDWGLWIDADGCMN